MIAGGINAHVLDLDTDQTAPKAPITKEALLVLKLIKRLNNSIIGDIIGVVCIAFIFIALPWFTVALA
jgi:hypothetical protein